MLNSIISAVNLQGWDLNRRLSVLAVSGGKDSMALLRAFVCLGYPCVVAHYNFQLRGEQSDLDEQCVKSACEKWNIPFYSERCNTFNFAEENHLSIQQAARELRYRFFERLRLELNADYLVTAHHQQDNLEHFFIYLLRNNLQTAWKGIPRENKKTHTIRPLLDVSPGQISDFLQQEGVEWREDASNAKTDYLRNRVRHWIIPQILNEFPNVFNEFGSLAQQFTLEMGQTAARFNTEYTEHRLYNSGWRFSFEEFHDFFMKEELSTHLKSELFKLGFTQSNVLQISSDTTQTGSYFRSAQNFEILRNRDEIWVYQVPEFQTNLSGATGETINGELGLVLEAVRPGDWIYFPKRKLRKKVSDYFNELKLSRLEKLHCRVLRKQVEDKSTDQSIVAIFLKDQILYSTMLVKFAHT